MTSDTHTVALAAALATELAAAVAAVLGDVVTASPVEPSGDDAGTGTGTGAGWCTPIAATGALTGTLTAGLDAAGVTAIATRMMHLEEEPEAGVVVEMLRELWVQAAAAVARGAAFEGLVLSAGASAAADLVPGAAAWVLRDGETTLATLIVTGQVTVMTRAAAATPDLSAPTAATGAGSTLSGNLAALLDVDLPLVVRFARTELSLRELTQLGPGSMVDMGRSPDDPVQVLVGSQVIAEGEVVVVDGNYGVRITSLVGPADRLKALEL